MQGMQGMQETVGVRSGASLAKQKVATLVQREPTPAACGECQLKTTCPIASTSDIGPAISEKIYDPGSRVFSEDNTFHKIYVIKSGSLQLSIKSPMLTQTIIGFGFPGELAGWEFSDLGAYMYSATTLEKSRLCAIETKTLLSSMRRDTYFRRRLLRAAALQVMREKVGPLAMLRGPAESKVAAFILDVFSRNQKYPNTAPNFVLSMPRNAISCYLGISPESLSRCLSSLSRKKAITVFNRRVSVPDLELLRKMAST